MFNEHRALRQIKPARAKQSIKVEDMTFKVGWEEQKIDGERYLLHTDCSAPGYEHAVTSRIVSKVTNRMVEKTDRVPHLTNLQGLPESAVFDNEFVSSGDIILRELPGELWDALMDKDHPHMQWLMKKYGGALPCYPHVSNTGSIMGSLAEEAIRKQEERGFIWAYCFDVLFNKGKDVRHLSLALRREFICRKLADIDPERGMVLMPRWNLTVDQSNLLFDIITAPTPDGHRGEGLILKDGRLPYNHARAWWKVKKDFTADVVLTGEYKMGREGVTGKMLGKVGALEFGVYYNGTLYPIGWMSAIMDSEAKLDELTTLAVTEQLRGRVVEICFNKFQDSDTYSLGLTLQHPRFGRWHTGKDASECTYEALNELRKSKG